MNQAFTEAIRVELQRVLANDGKPFTVSVARRVYTIAIAAKDLLHAAGETTGDAVEAVKDSGGPLDRLDHDADGAAPGNQIQASETFGARMFRELIAALPTLRPQPASDPVALVHALADARKHGMIDVVEELEKKLFGKVLIGSRPVSEVEHELLEAMTP